MRHHQTHGFGPVYNENSRILILGSFPSVKSREQNFYYGHPQNRFWKVIAALTGEPVPVAVNGPRGSAGEAIPTNAGTPVGTPASGMAPALGSDTASVGAATEPPGEDPLVAARRALVLRHGIALWDSIESCEIEGSSDASIRGIVPVDIARITEHCAIQVIVANGAAAQKYYDRYLRPVTGMEAIRLPSTSPANAAWSLERLIDAWQEALGEYL